MKVAVIVELERNGAYANVETVLLYESDGRKALETFATMKNVEPRITHKIGDHWRLAISYRAVDGKDYDNFYTAVINDGIEPEKPPYQQVNPSRYLPTTITVDGVTMTPAEYMEKYPNGR